MVRWKSIFRRAVMITLVVLTVLVVIVVARWQIAKQRVSDVATASSSIVLSAVKSRTASARSYVTEPANGEASHIAVMHKAAINQYRERSEADKAALPQIVKALDAVQVEWLKSLPDAGNARAACVLSVQISKCIYLPGQVRAGISQIEQRISQLDRIDRSGMAQLEINMSESLRVQQRLNAECAGFNVGSEHTAWKFQLQSALMGFEPAMRSFSAWPPFDPADASNSIDAVAAYMNYAGQFTEALAQRGDLNAVTSAGWDYSDYGPNFLGVVGLRPLPKDPARALMWAYVREAVMRGQEAVSPGSSRAWGIPSAMVDRIVGTVGDEGRVWARQMADQMLAFYEPSVFQPIPQPPETTPRREIWEDQEAACRE